MVGNTTSLTRTPDSIWDYFLEENIWEFESGNSVGFTPFHPGSRFFGESLGGCCLAFCVGFVFCVCFCFGWLPTMSRCRSFLPDLMTVRAVMVRAAMEKKKKRTFLKVIPQPTLGRVAISKYYLGWIAPVCFLFGNWWVYLSWRLQLLWLGWKHLGWVLQFKLTVWEWHALHHQRNAKKHFLAVICSPPGRGQSLWLGTVMHIGGRSIPKERKEAPTCGLLA